MADPDRPPTDSSLDTDSTLGDDLDSDSESVTSSVLNYEYENGRRYHAFRAGAYPIPNDEVEQDRMDLLHHIQTLVLGGELYRAPMDEMHRILDIGTGTGIWAIDIADLFPNAQVIAIDLSPIQPTFVPPNLEFFVEDCESDWLLDQDFDYVHIRNMAGSISNWPRLLKRVSEHLRPGGYVEITDFDAWGSTDDDSLPESSSYHQWQKELARAAGIHGRPMNVMEEVKDHLQKDGKGWGLEQVHWTVEKVPLSPWPEDPRLRRWGYYMNELMLRSVEAYSLALFTRVLQWPLEETQMLMAGVRKDLKNTDYHLYSRLHYIWARKIGSTTPADNGG